MSPSDERDCPSGEAGFTLVEVLIALAVVAMSLAAIGSLVSTTVHGARSIDQRLALVETAQSVMTGLPRRGQLAPGTTSGILAGHRWRLEVSPLSADFIDPSRPAPWVPQAVVVSVTSPSGQVLRVDTVRLQRPGSRR